LKSKKSASRIPIGIRIPLALIAGYVLLFLTIRLACFPVSHTSVWRYGRDLKEWKKTGLVEHFPQDLPASAKNVRFSSFPGFLQGGGWIQLRLELPTPEIRRIYEDATNSAKQYHDGGNSVTLVNRQNDGLCSTDFHTSGTTDGDFPEDYRVFVFDAVAYHTNGVHLGWNHGRSRGVAVSTQRNDVVYWAERW
jgi:hypothetical protein